MRISVANGAGCLVTAVNINFIATNPGMVSKCLLSDSVSSFAYPSIIHAVMRSGALAQGVALKKDSLTSMSFFVTKN